jgi:hypothetical protein
MCNFCNHRFFGKKNKFGRETHRLSNKKFFLSLGTCSYPKDKARQTFDWCTWLKFVTVDIWVTANCLWTELQTVFESPEYSLDRLAKAKRSREWFWHRFVFLSRRDNWFRRTLQSISQAVLYLYDQYVCDQDFRVDHDVLPQTEIDRLSYLTQLCLTLSFKFLTHLSSLCSSD